MKNKFVFLLLCAIGYNLWAQSIINEVQNQVPLKKVVILTSGLAYYEHSGTVNGEASLNIPFRIEAVNDALKTIVVNDPSSANPSIVYQSEQTLLQTLRSLKIDLSDEPGIAAILSKLRGAEVEITSPTPYSGRIAGIEYRPVFSSSYSQSSEPWLMLNTKEGIKLFNLKEINSINFKDSVIEHDLNRALDLITESRNSFSKQLFVNLPASGRRNVSISYVIPSPVWKVSYRLDLSAAKPLFQGWAIVDNDSDNDWNNVELSLVAGRPVSFIQNLYPPYYVSRPTLPLSIAGTAEAQAHDSGVAFSDMAAPRARTEAAPMTAQRYILAEEPNIAGGTIQTASGSEAGGQFEFTIKNPVSLNRRMSAMLPLVESSIEARKLLIYGGAGRHPRLGAEITNTSGMNLPAGLITVYDGGVYAGDALIEFWSDKEKRLISFGEDLSVTASASDANTRTVSSVTVSGGVMTINRSQIFAKTYTFINSSSVSKQLTIEHTKTANTSLVSPKETEQTASGQTASSQTAAIYRFNVALPANRETSLTVSEQRPLSERITLLPLRQDAFLSYTTNQEIPPRVRTALLRAVELRNVSDAADQTVKDIEAQKNRLIADQDRIRRNLEAAGNQTQQGQEYLKRLVSLDSEIDALTVSLDRAINSAKTAREAWENYINGLNLQ
jgi:hypothetical protein